MESAYGGGDGGWLIHLDPMPGVFDAGAGGVRIIGME